ncbi:MAG: hypothetical protein HYR51_20640 [Candidatus Rokubacteria bacterium]|nr:hypothetical protein [Candidatus Rokubacteria bacterium]
MRARALACAALVACATAAGAGASAAASLALGEPEKREALAYGQRTAHREGFDAEWRVTNGAGETAIVLTPFHRLVIAARHATFRGKPLKAGEPDRLLREQKDRLVVWVELRGQQEDFARQLVPELVVARSPAAQDRVVKPAFVQNERTPARREDGGYLARCVYAFPVKELAGSSRLALVVRDSDGREARRFAIDLSAMR